MLPSLAGFLDRGRIEDFIRTVNRALRVMLALGLPAAALLAVGVRPLAQVVFGYDAARLDLVAACTWAFLFGLVGDCWLEVAVRSFYAHQDTRTPLLAAFCQAAAFVILSLLLTPFIGLAGIPLAAALTFTVQALVLLALLNRRFPGMLQVGVTAWRAVPAGLLAALLAVGVLHILPLSVLPGTLLALTAGVLVSLPLVWPELRLLSSL
jgi:putative peptidoglycan lipid II flippase